MFLSVIPVQYAPRASLRGGQTDVAPSAIRTDVVVRLNAQTLNNCREHRSSVCQTKGLRCTNFFSINTEGNARASGWVVLLFCAIQRGVIISHLGVRVSDCLHPFPQAA